jgi:heme exporter protein CcmD
MDNFIGTNPYAVYLLVAYGVTGLVVIGNIVVARSGFRATLRRLKQQLARREARSGGRSAMIDSNRQSVSGKQP